MFLKDQTRKAPVMLVYIVPSVALARAAKKHILDRAGFMERAHPINFGSGKDNVGMIVVY